jgi:hypothetical protein
MGFLYTSNLGLLRTLTSKGLNWPLINCRIDSISSGVCGIRKKIGASLLIIIEFHAKFENTAQHSIACLPHKIISYEGGINHLHFCQCFGFGRLDSDPYWECGSGSMTAKDPQK